MLTIFDCDGVLVDSEELAAEVFAEQLGREEIVITAAECHEKFKGLTLPACVVAIEQGYGRRLPHAFLDELRAATAARFAQSLKPIEGVAQVLAWLDAEGVTKCVASNGGSEKIAHSLSVTGLSAHFVHRFSADAVAHGKPAPDLFFMAADALGFAPHRCVVIEDSAAGVAAARAAGMHVLLYCAANAGAVDEAAVQTFSDMRQLPDLLRALWSGG